MQASIPHPRKSLPVWFSAILWLLMFFSPTAYLGLLIFANHAQIPGPPEQFIVVLFCLVPVVALFVCESAVWRSRMTVAWKIAGMLTTLLAMLLQLCVLGAVLYAILVALTSYSQ